MPNIFRKAKNLGGMPLFVQCWLPPSWLLLGLSRIILFTVPFKRLVPWLGICRRTSWVPLLSQTQEARARQIGYVVRLASRYTPWHSHCFPQALVARMLLGFYRIPYVLNLGLARDAGTDTLKAHAWVSAGRVAVTGGRSFRQFTTISCFVGTATVGGKTA